ncbi:MAG TPA: AsmA family protein [Edaphobacter sp.]|nr:AsmA family protein [Edaphobacter sp.]
MKHWQKIASAVVGVGIVAVAAVPLFVNVNTFRPLLERQLTAALGRKVTMGKLSLSVLSSDVVARDLSIADDPAFGSAPFLTAKSLHLGVELRPLIFSHKIIVRRLRIDEPQIRLVHGEQGIWNFSTLGNSAASHSVDTAQETAIPDLTVNKLSIEGGKATIESLPAHGVPLTFDQIALAVENFSFTRQFPFKLSASVPGQGTVTLTGQAGPIDPRNAAATVFDARLMMKHFDPVAAGVLDRGAGMAALADVDAHLASDGVAISSNGTVHLQTLQLSPKGSPAKKPVDVVYKTSHNLKANAGQLENATVTIGSLTANLNGSYSLTPATSLNLKLTGEGMPVDELQTLLPVAGVHLPNGSVLKGGQLTIDLGIAGSPENLTITGPFEIDNTRLAGFNLSSKLKGIASLTTGQAGEVTDIRAMRARVQVANSGIRVDDIYTSMPALGEATGQGTVSPAGALNFRLMMKVNTSKGVGGAAVGLLSTLNQAVGTTARQTAANGVPVTITGTSSNPVITPDVNGLLRENATSILGIQKGNQKKDAGQQVMRTLGGLFGKK